MRRWTGHSCSSRFRAPTRLPSNTFYRDIRLLKKSLPIVLALLLFLGIVLAILWNSPPNLDSSWLLYATAEWLGGKRLYVDILELNPPLIFLLNVPAVTAKNFSAKLSIASSF